MAVRDDFTAGEVLAAADLNDTFAQKLPYSYGTATPSTTDSGFLWYDSNSTPPVPKYWDGSAFANLAPAPGLELITAETFSAVSSVSINGCFSSSYQNYRIMINSTGANGFDVRLRVSGTDNSASDYDTAGSYFGTATAAFNTLAQTAWVFNINNQQTKSVIMDLINPNAAVVTQGHSSNYETSAAGTHYATLRNLGHRAATSFDGFSVIATGSASGKILVYGYSE